MAPARVPQVLEFPLIRKAISNPGTYLSHEDKSALPLDHPIRLLSYDDWVVILKADIDTPTAVKLSLRSV